MISARRRTMLSAILACVVVGLAGIDWDASAATDPIAQDVLDGIRRHEQLLASFDIEFWCNLENLEPHPRFAQTRNLKRYNVKGRMLYSNSGFRIDSESASLSEDGAGSIVQKNAIESLAYDGTVRTQVQTGIKQARITTEVLPIGWNPLLAGVYLDQGIAPHGAFGKLDQVREWKYGGTETIHGFECVLIEGLNESSENYQRLWVCPDRGFRMVRFEAETTAESPEGLRELARWETMEFLEAKPGVWFPTKIRNVGLGVDVEGATKSTYNTAEIELTVRSVNDAIESDKYTVEIPIGFRVRDDIRDINYVQGRLNLETE